MDERIIKVLNEARMNEKIRTRFDGILNIKKRDTQKFLSDEALVLINKFTQKLRQIMTPKLHKALLSHLGEDTFCLTSQTKDLVRDHP